jgi:hypothetical protein
VQCVQASLLATRPCKSVRDQRRIWQKSRIDDRPE